MWCPASPLSVCCPTVKSHCRGSAARQHAHQTKVYAHAPSSAAVAKQAVLSDALQPRATQNRVSTPPAELQLGALLVLRPDVPTVAIHARAQQQLYISCSLSVCGSQVGKRLEGVRRNQSPVRGAYCVGPACMRLPRPSLAPRSRAHVRPLTRMPSPPCGRRLWLATTAIGPRLSTLPHREVLRRERRGSSRSRWSISAYLCNESSVWRSRRCSRIWIRNMASWQ